MSYRLQELIRNQDEGQTLVHQATSLGEKVLRNTHTSGREDVKQAIKDIQNDWDRLIKKLANAKVAGVEWSGGHCVCQCWCEIHPECSRNMCLPLTCVICAINSHDYYEADMRLFCFNGVSFGDLLSNFPWVTTDFASCLPAAQAVLAAEACFVVT